MARKYRQFSLEERCEIARLHAEGRSFQQIAATLDRSPSSISREVKRNASSKLGYRPAYAAEQAKARRWKGSKLDRKPELRQAVLHALAQRCSPEQVAGRLACQAGHSVISHETIYRFINAQITRHNDFSWRHYLPRAKAKRGWRGRKGGSSAGFIQGRVSIDERPAEAERRQVLGHWEADLMQFSAVDQNVLALLERSSRLLIGQRPANKTAPLIADIIEAIMAALPPPLRKTITFDNVLRAELEVEVESSHDISICKIAPAASSWSTQIRDKPTARRLPRMKEKISSIANTGSRSVLALTVLNTSF